MKKVCLKYQIKKSKLNNLNKQKPNHHKIFICIISRINKSSFKIDWNNNFDILNEKYVCNNENKGQDNELKIIRKATVLVNTF